MVFLNGEPLTRRRRIKTCSMVMQDVNHQLFADSVFNECELACENEMQIRETLALLDLVGLEERHPLALSVVSHDTELLARCCTRIHELAP